MNTNMYHCCNDNSNYDQILSDNDSINSSSNIDPVNKTIKDMNNDLCNMRVTLAETNATLQFLAQVMCSRGTLCDIEKSLLLNLEKGLKNLGCEVKENSNNLDYLDYLIR